MSKCKNCGHDSHCGIVLNKTVDNEDRSIEICKQCRCYRCTVKTDWG